MTDIKYPYIYESPDGGHTVYRRPMGGAVTERELHSISEEKRTLYEDLQESKLWGEIRRAAKTDPALQELLDRVIVYHRLKSQP